MYLRIRGVGTAEHPDRRFLGAGSHLLLGQFGGMGKVSGRLGNSFLQQQKGCLEQRLRLESLLHRAAEEQVGEREKTHALMVGHERAHHHLRLAGRQTRGGVVDRFIETVSAEKAVLGQPFEIQAGLAGRDHQRHHRGVGGDHQIFGEPAFQPQAGDAEGTVLIVMMDIDGVVAALGDAPRHAAFFAVFDLAGHRRLAGLIEQGVFIGRHDEQRHQIFEHRAAPRQEDRRAVGGGEQTSEGKPAFLRQLSLGNGHEPGKPRFRSEQVVAAGIQAMLADIVADGQQTLGGVEEEAVFHLGELGCPAGQIFDGGHPGRALPGGGSDMVFHFYRLAKGRDFIEVGDVAGVSRRRKFHPRCEEGQITKGIAALVGKGPGPPPQLTAGIDIDDFHLGRHQRGSRCQLQQSQPHCGQGERRGGYRLVQLFPQFRPRGRNRAPGYVGEASQGVAQPFKQSTADNR
ncbi:MAG: hypothetical protein ACD_75C01930G0001 [uncultured bacterium]|nr:MAG: hypothetical protein ACD_75C01930G0001 [uncultured bacterium]